MATIRVARKDGETVEEVALQAESLEIIEKPNGPAAAALIASGVGVFFLGLFTTWAEASTSFANDVLKLDNDVGPLSGKTAFAVVAYVIAWAVLAPVLWKKSLPWATVLVIAGALIAAGFIGTFPKFFDLFAED